MEEATRSYFYAFLWRDPVSKGAKPLVPSGGQGDLRYYF